MTHTHSTQNIQIWAGKLNVYQVIANIINAHDMERNMDDITMRGCLIFLNCMTRIRNINKSQIHKLFHKSTQTASCASISAQTSYLTPSGRGLFFII